MPDHLVVEGEVKLKNQLCSVSMLTPFDNSMHVGEKRIACRLPCMSNSAGPFATALWQGLEGMPIRLFPGSKDLARSPRISSMDNDISSGIPEGFISTVCALGRRPFLVYLQGLCEVASLGPHHLQSTRCIRQFINPVLSCGAPALGNIQVPLRNPCSFSASLSYHLIACSCGVYSGMI